MRAIALCLLLVLPGCHATRPPPPPAAPTLRVATYNGSLYDERDGGLVARLQAGDEAARKIAAVIQHQRPDLLLLNEFDYDAAGRAADLFQQRYLGVSQSGQAPIEYPYRFIAPVNTGVPSRMDLDRNGKVGGGNDAWGFGLHPGQYGLLVLSRYPIDADAVRTFQHFRWQDLPGARSPLDPKTGQPWYPPEVWSKLRLSSKSHWDVPVRTPIGRLHFLVHHPTPPVFDGAEDRNGVRNRDEIRFWAEYLAPRPAPWLCSNVPSMSKSTSRRSLTQTPSGSCAELRASNSPLMMNVTPAICQRDGISPSASHAAAIARIGCMFEYIDVCVGPNVLTPWYQNR